VQQILRVVVDCAERLVVVGLVDGQVALGIGAHFGELVGQRLEVGSRYRVLEPAAEQNCVDVQAGHLGLGQTCACLMEK